MGLRDRLLNRMMAPGGISVEEALTLLSSGGVLVDVRSEREYEAGHAPGARLADVKELVKDAFTAVHGDDPLVEPDATVVLICDTGLRSGHAVEPVRRQGFGCEFVGGGLLAWRQAGQVVIPGPPRNRR